MQQPIPYNIVTGGSGAGTPPDTSPLQASGSDYPCKIPSGGSLGGSPSNTAAVGSTIPMSFKGTAVHNGGSCQVSLTKDTASSLSANSQFKVIYSILGGCPGTSGATTTYNVPIPEDVPAGDYVYAWTWFNVIGNREMYMNCAPITITGGSGSDASFNALPDMAVYNIASKNTCKTAETFDVDFPNPGKYTEKGSTFKPQAPTCDGTDAGTGAGGPGSGLSGGSGSTGGGASPASSANNGQYTGVGAGGSQGGAGAGPSPSATQTFDDGQYHPSTQVKAPSSATVVASSNAVAPSPVVASSVAVAPSPASSTLATSSTVVRSPTGVSTPGVGLVNNGTVATPQPAAGNGPASGAACAPGITMICSDDGTQFGLCDRGSAIMQPVAAGTKCVNNNISRRRRNVVVKLPFPFNA